MKKIALCLLAVLLIGICSPAVSLQAAAAIDTNVSIHVNGQRLYPDVAPFIQNDRTLVPVRGIFEKLGADVQWNESEQKATINYGNTSIILWIGHNTAIVNGYYKQMDVPPTIYNNRTMIPLRFIAENIGMWVQWVNDANVATITDPSYFDNLPAKTVLGYTTYDYTGDTASYNSVVSYSGNMDAIATFSYQVDFDGSLIQTGLSQKSTVRQANSNNVKSLLLVHNMYQHTFDRNLAHTVLSDPAKRKKLIDSILVAVSKEECAGVNIDIENVAWYDREYYTSFVKELKETMTPHGYLTTLSIPAKTSDMYSGNLWSGGFDYAALGKYADQLMLMTYDEHYFGGSAGPISSLPWVEKVLSYAVQQIDPQKLLLGIAGYGYDWSSSGSKVVTYKKADSVISEFNTISSWDSIMQAPYFTYIKDGVLHTVWYENSRSISAKLDLVNKYQLGGIGIWRLGYDNDDFWNTVRSKLN